jgi:hypothetical protein
MFDTPKTFNAPGFDMPLREQTLAEFVMVLDEQHLVRRELRELQRRSAQAAQLSAENQSLQEKVRELEGRAGATMPTAPPNISTVAVPPYDYEKARNLTPTKIEKIPCKLCGKPIARGKVYWATHLHKAHPQTSPIDLAQE